MVKDATDPCTITATLLPQVTQRAFDRAGSRLLVGHSTWGAAPPR
jgi:hypothetical protein